MKKALLLEDFDPSITYEDKITVSLSPAASYFLIKNKIPYTILENYYDERWLRRDEEKYFFEQLAWFADFDNFFKKYIPECGKYGIPLATANYLRLKYFIDTVIIFSKIIAAFIASNPGLEELIYSYKDRGDTRPSIFKFKNSYKKVFCGLLKLFAAKNNIRFTERKIEDTIPSKDTGRSRAFINNEFIKSYLKNIRNIFKYAKISAFLCRDKAFTGTGIFFMHAGSADIDYPIKEALKHKAQVYLMEGKKVLHENGLLRRQAVIPSCGDEFFDCPDREFTRCAEDLLKEERLIEWVNNRCGVGASSILLPFLTQFVKYECSHMLKEAKAMLNFYKKNNIAYVFGRGNTDIDSQGSLIAARYMKGAKSICIEHASFVIDMPVMGVFETETYDYILARDGISEDYFRSSLEKRYKAKCEVRQSPHYIREVAKRYAAVKASGRKRALYVEKKFSGRIRCFNNMNYPLAWYFEYQRKIIDYMASEKNFIFIYKHSPSQDWAADSILRYIEDIKAENIKVSQKHFLKELNTSDMVIVDYPSGALCEAAAAGKSVLCLYADYFRIISKAREAFGGVLRKFSSAEEAIGIIKEFINGDPEDYVVKEQFYSGDFFEVFKDIVFKEKNG